MLLYISKVIYKCVKVKEKVGPGFNTKFEQISLNRCTFKGAVFGWNLFTPWVTNGYEKSHLPIVAFSVAIPYCAMTGLPVRVMWGPVT